MSKRLNSRKELEKCVINNRHSIKVHCNYLTVFHSHILHLDNSAWHLGISSSILVFISNFSLFDQW